MTATRLGVDVGGTFTDLVALVGDDIVTVKLPTTRDQSDGVMAAVEASGVDVDDVEVFAHGTTVATNALLERAGARTASVTTEGFRDIIEIGRQDRLSLYDLARDRPPALVPRALRFCAGGRMGPEGEVHPLTEDEIDRVVDEVKAGRPEAVAVCLLFSFRYPDHERKLADSLRAAFPDVEISVSSELLPEFREYERLSTVTANAYLGPRLSAYLGRLERRAASGGLPAPSVMQSSGGVLPINDAARRAAACVLSGPAGGVVGGAYVARASGYDDVLTFDMGGTSTDVAAVIGGRVETATEAVVAGVPLRFPMVDVHTVSAGGGSIAWIDAGGALRAGPRSAGAHPGPAAYGRGGTAATVTDANLVLGYLEHGAELGGEVILDRERSDDCFRDLAARAGIDPLRAAAGTIEVANVEMVRALRYVTVERGLDPRDFALMAFGGAGPMHACALAEELGIERVLVARAGGVLSALGLALSELRRDYVRPLLGAVDETEPAALDRLYAEMERDAHSDLSGPAVERFADLRYRGQSFELTVPAAEIGTLVDRFHEAHEGRFGYRVDDAPVEVVALRVVATVPARDVSLREPGPSTETAATTRRVYLDGEWIDVPVRSRGALGRGARVRGPAIVEFPESTCVVRPGWSGEVDGAGTLVLKRS